MHIRYCALVAGFLFFMAVSCGGSDDGCEEGKTIVNGICEEIPDSSDTDDIIWSTDGDISDGDISDGDDDVSPDGDNDSSSDGDDDGSADGDIDWSDDCENCDGPTEYCDAGDCVDDCAGRVCGESPVKNFNCGSCQDDENCSASGQCQELPDVSIDWISIPSGSFWMGCSPDDDFCAGAGREEPRHEVSMSAFNLMATEVTQQQYLAIAGDNPSTFQSCGDSCPVDNVYWDEADDFCRAIGGRLPSEAEWEYAARGGSSTKYSCGSDSICLNEIAWFEDNSDNTIHPVGMKTPNGFGLFDMTGNVSEWAQECWHDNFSSAPADGSAWESDCDNYQRRMVRGGRYRHKASDLRVSGRGSILLSDKEAGLGFRCAK